MPDITEFLLSALERQSKINAQQFDDLRSSIATLRRQVGELGRRIDLFDASSRQLDADDGQPSR
jgi:phage shock protein A